jgi:hypothetical protein
MPPLASTGRPSRRSLLEALAVAPALVALGARLRAADYASAAEALAAVDALEAEVGQRLGAIAERVPSARPFVASVLRDHGAHRAARGRLRRRLGLAPAAVPCTTVDDPAGLAALRAAQERQVHAHAEGLPALDDRVAVETMARHMVELSRHLTVIDLWVEAEESRG